MRREEANKVATLLARQAAALLLLLFGNLDIFEKFQISHRGGRDSLTLTGVSVFKIHLKFKFFASIVTFFNWTVISFP